MYVLWMENFIFKDSSGMMDVNRFVYVMMELLDIIFVD